MELILHLGFPKTGTTSLQNALDKSRADLRKRGVWYPLVEPNLSRRQNILATCFQAKPQRVYVNKRFKGLLPSEYAEIQWAEISRKAKKFDKVIISSEHLGAIKKVDEFYGFLQSSFSNLSVRAIFYLRTPSDHFVSSLQQRVKANHRLKNFKPVNFYSVVREWKSYFPVEIRELTPTKLVGGSLISDFCEFAEIDLQLADQRSNVGHSAEASQILQDYGKAFRDDEKVSFSKDLVRLAKLLHKVDGDNFKKARLKPEFLQSIDHSKQVYELKDKFGFLFSKIDYQESPNFDEDLFRLAEDTEVRDLLEFDESNWKALHTKLMGELLRP